MSVPLLYETHTHTRLCNHAEGECEDYARVAQERGFKGLLITCHNPLPDGVAVSTRMEPDQFDEYLSIVRCARDSCANIADVRLGIECDYMPGFEPFLAAQLQIAPFEYVLGAIHPHLAEYGQRYLHDDDLAFQAGYFSHLADMAETGLFDTIAHPDMVKNMYPDTWRLDLLLDHVCRCLDRIAATGVAMELNTSGVNKTIPEMNPSETILSHMHERRIPVVIDADAHVPERVGDGYETALEMIANIGYTHASFFLERRRHEVAVADALASLQPVDAAG